MYKVLALTLGLIAVGVISFISIQSRSKEVMALDNQIAPSNVSCQCGAGCGCGCATGLACGCQK